MENLQASIVRKNCIIPLLQYTHCKKFEEEEEIETRDWSELEIDILEIIIKRLDPVEHLKFGGVCRPWRSIRSLHRASLIPSRPHSALLMLPSLSLSCHRRFINPLNGGRYTFTLYELFAEKCIGSSGSWLIMKGRNHYIYNPFTLTKIMWPKKDIPDFYESVIALSKPDTPEFSLIAFTGYPRSLHYIRHNDKKWSSHDYNHGIHTEAINQAVAVNGKFYAMTARGRLAFIDLDRESVLEWKDEIARVKFDRGREHAYLMESNGELLLIITTCAKCKHDECVQACRVFKLDMAKSTWISAERTIEGRILFVGSRGSMSVEAREGGGTARVYTAGKESFGMFDPNTSEGSICCDHDGKAESALWVLPELLYRDREPKWWTALYNTNDRLLKRVYAALFVLILLSSFSLPLVFGIVVVYLWVNSWALWTCFVSENE